MDLANAILRCPTSENFSFKNTKPDKTWNHYGTITACFSAALLRIDKVWTWQNLTFKDAMLLIIVDIQNAAHVSKC